MSKRDPIASARWRYIISYILVSVLPLLFCAGFIMVVNHNSNRTQLETAMLDKLELVKTQLDLMFKKLETASMHFETSGVWASYEQDYDDNDISQQLRAFWETYPFVEDVVYLPVGKSYIFTPRRRMEYDAFSALKSNLVSLELSAFFTHMNTLTTTTLLPTHRSTQRYVDGGRVLFLQPVPRLDAVRQGAIAFFIREKAIYEIFEDCFFDSDAYYYILDQNMSIIYTNETGKEADVLRSRMSQLRGTGLFLQQVDQREFVLMRTVSETSGAYYMAAIPSNVFYAQIAYLQGNQALILLVSLLLVAAFSILLALFFYRPLEQFLRKFSTQTDSSFHSHSQGLLQAGELMTRISDDHAALSAQLDDHQRVLMRQLASGLLQGQLHEHAVTLLLNQLQLTWQGNGFIALHAWLSPAEKTPGFEHWSIPQGEVYAVPGEHGETLALLADVRRVPDLPAEVLRRHVAEACIQYLEENGREQVRLGVGGLRTQYMELSASYLEAQAMGRGLMNEGTPSIALFKMSATGILSDSFLPLAEKELLVQCMISGNFPAACEALTVLQENLAPFSGNRVLMRSVFFYLYDAMVTTAGSLQLATDRNGLDQGVSGASLDAFMQALRAYLKDACAMVERRKRHSASYTQHKILTYVNEHFKEHTLSMDELCATFDLSASYLSRFFKQETGYSFLQYTGQLRMNYVKTQLTQTKKPIKDIVQEAGYLDPASFIRKFRQQEGMTPGEYRNKADNV